MKYIIKFLGLLIVLIGVWVLINPNIFFGYIENNWDSLSFYRLAIATRIILGILFIVAAKDSKYPTVIKIIGFVFILAAVIFILIGHNGFQDFASSMTPFAKPITLGAGLVGLLLGGLLIYTFSTKKESEI